MKSLRAWFLCAIMLSTTVVAGADYGLVPKNLLDMGFVIKRIEVTTVLEKADEAATTTAPAEPEIVEETVIEEPPVFNEPISEPLYDIWKLDEDAAAAAAAPETDDGKKWIQSKVTGKAYHVDSTYSWYEAPDGVFHGVAPGKVLIYSRILQGYFQVDPNFAYWDTAAGIISTQKGNQLVRGSITGNYYEIPANQSLSEIPTYGGGVELRYTTTTTASTPTVKHTDNYRIENYSSGCDGCPGGICPSGTCPY